jgi:predicted NBD/HSP70 family sugar kinase
MKSRHKLRIVSPGYVESEGRLFPARPGELRQINIREILRLLRQHNPCSCADLVRHSGLSAPTVSSTIEYLRRKGLVERIGTGTSNGGRPPSMLRFNDRFGYVAGADIGGTGVRVALADLNGKILGKWESSIQASSSPKNVAALIVSGIHKLERLHNIPAKKLLAVAAGAPGITDTRAGIVLSAPNLSGWKGVPLRQILEDAVQVPVSIENDVNLAALGESWSGIAKGVKNFVFVAIGTGIGAGLFVNGRLYHGSDWAAGEIGYLYVPGTEEAPLAIHRPGPLESIIGGDGISEMWQRLQNGKFRSGRRQRWSLKATEIFDLAVSGDGKAHQVLQHTARILANAIADVSVILNTSMVILGGRVGTHSALFEATRRILERNEVARPQLTVSSLGQDAQLFGAVWLALKTAEQRALP